MSISTRLYARANALLKSGKVDDARRLLTVVLQDEPDNQAAWTLYRKTQPTDSQQQALLKKLKRPNALADLPAARPLRETVSTAAPGRQSRSPWLVLALMMLFGFALTAVYLLTTAANRISLDRANAQYNTLITQYDALKQTQISLEENHQLLNEAYTQLQLDYGTAENARLQLVSEYDSLQQKHDQTLAAYNELNEQFNNLQATHNDLVTKHYQLSNEKDALQIDYNNLATAYENLSAIGQFPPYILVQGRQVHIAFRKYNDTIVRWEVDFADLEQAIEQGHDARGNPLTRLTDQVKLSASDGSYFYARDFRTFVDPSPFRNVVPELYYASSSPDEFIREIWHIATQLTTYSYEMTETPRYPLETLLAGGGDCEDTAILVASMLKAAPVNWEVGLIYMDADNPTVLADINHVMVYVNTGSQQYYIETTSSWDMEPNGNVAGWYLMIEG